MIKGFWHILKNVIGDPINVNLVRIPLDYIINELRMENYSPIPSPEYICNLLFKECHSIGWFAKSSFQNNNQIILTFERITNHNLDPMINIILHDLEKNSVSLSQFAKKFQKSKLFISFFMAQLRYPQEDRHSQLYFSQLYPYKINIKTEQGKQNNGNNELIYTLVKNNN